MLDSRGPVFYRQPRVGLFGEPYDIFKIRSMRTDAEAAGKAVWASANDPRVTRVGRVIRKLRIDELPQTWGVLKGDMSRSEERRVGKGCVSTCRFRGGR